MRPYNFSPGPAALPLEVLEQAREELLDWRASGMSVMEISHRGKAFMQGGASAQFAIVPLNLAGAGSTADYIDTGHWSKKAIAEARRYCSVRLAGDAGGEYRHVPPQRELRFDARAAYAHYTPN